MAKKKEAASKLLAALGKTKKEQMAKLYPKVKGQIRGKGPYVRGTIGKKIKPSKALGIPSSKTFQARRAVLSGAKATKAPSKAAKHLINVAVAGTTGYAVGKGWHKKLAGAVTPKEKETHREKARRGAKELIKKQKAKKEKRKSHH